MTELLSGPEIAPASGGQARGLIIFLHGYGADGNDLIGLGPHFAEVVPDVAFVSPNAPERCGGSPFGYQWYDVWMQDRAERLAAIRRAASLLDAFITSEIDRWSVPEDRVMLVGFSQGTMMSLFVAPRRARPVGGILGYSGRLEAPDLLSDELQCRPPVILAHGDSDELLPLQEMENASSALRGCGFEVATHVCNGLGHGINETGLEIGRGFVRRVLGDIGGASG